MCVSTCTHKLTHYYYYYYYRELRETFEALDTEPGVRAILITGSGRAFCSGGDVEAIIGELEAGSPYADPRLAAEMRRDLATRRAAR